MTVTAGALRVLHRLHQQLSDLRERLDRGPKQIRAREQNVANLETQFSSEQKEAQQARMTVDKKQLDLKSSENKVMDWKTKLNSCTTNKEYQALLDQIAAAEMAGSVLSDEILEALEKIDELDVKVKQAREHVETAQQELQTAKQHVANSSEAITTDVHRLELELAEAEKALPTDFSVNYHRIVRAKGADALAQVDGTYCGGCFQKITANMQNDLTLSRAVFCLSCDRLLYFDEADSTNEGD